MKNPVNVQWIKSLKTSWSYRLATSVKKRSNCPHDVALNSVKDRHPAAMRYPSRELRAPDGPCSQ